MPEPLSVCYLNGEFMPLREARVSPLDRAFLFADSVYEVLPAFAGRLFRFQEHFDRLARSLELVRIRSPYSHVQWRKILEDLVRRNGSVDQYLYVQVTRGTEYGRNHAFPGNIEPTVFAMCSPLPQWTDAQREHGFSAITIEDFRWERCNIKSTMLLANVLMKQQAAEQGANEAIIVRDGQVLEGSSTSILLLRGGALATPPNSNRILPGTTRDVALELAAGIFKTEIRPVRVDELFQADEIWMAAATRDVLPITRVDGRIIGSGRPGSGWQQMSEAFVRYREQNAHTPPL
ncbi:MAG TPA: D-amino acid aminotransferase [Steroidobacteraceae bacterium]|nr:D-amino acid aminotransferase [Steroidobacteraceae bacterium]